MEVRTRVSVRVLLTPLSAVWDVGTVWLLEGSRVEQGKVTTQHSAAVTLPCPPRGPGLQSGQSSEKGTPLLSVLPLCPVLLPSASRHALPSPGHPLKVCPGPSSPAPSDLEPLTTRDM